MWLKQSSCWLYACLVTRASVFIMSEVRQVHWGRVISTAALCSTVSPTDVEWGQGSLVVLLKEWKSIWNKTITSISLQCHDLYNQTVSSELNRFGLLQVIVIAGAASGAHVDSFTPSLTRTTSQLLRQAVASLLLPNEFILLSLLCIALPSQVFLFPFFHIPHFPHQHMPNPSPFSSCHICHDGVLLLLFSHLSFLDILCRITQRQLWVNMQICLILQL